MRLLRRRPVADARELAACVAACIGGLGSGLRVADRPPTVAEAMADVVAVDAAGRLILIVCEPEAAPAAVLRALECAAWWCEHRGFIPRAVPGALESIAPRAVLVATRFPERTLRVLRALGPAGPVGVECRLYDDGAMTGVSLEPVVTNGDVGAQANGVAAAEAGAPAARPPATEGVGERLARLRFREAFR